MIKSIPFVLLTLIASSLPLLSQTPAGPAPNGIIKLFSPLDSLDAPCECLPQATLPGNGGADYARIMRGMKREDAVLWSASEVAVSPLRPIIDSLRLGSDRADCRLYPDGIPYPTSLDERENTFLADYNYIWRGFLLAANRASNDSLRRVWQMAAIHLGQQFIHDRFSPDELIVGYLALREALPRLQGDLIAAGDTVTQCCVERYESRVTGEIARFSQQVRYLSMKESSGNLTARLSDSLYMGVVLGLCKNPTEQIWKRRLGVTLLMAQARSTSESIKRQSGIVLDELVPESPYIAFRRDQFAAFTPTQLDSAWNAMSTPPPQMHRPAQRSPKEIFDRAKNRTDNPPASMPPSHPKPKP